MTGDLRFGSFPVRVLWTMTALAVAIAATTALPAVAAPSRDMVVPTSVSTEQGIRCKEFGSATTQDAGNCMTDNASVSYYMIKSGEWALEAADQTVVKNVAARYNATDLSVSLVSTPVTSGSGQTDVIFQEGSRGMGSLAGITFCNDKASGTTWQCDQQYVQIRGYDTYTEKSAGHEMGHAVGLLHGSNASPIQGNECAAELGIMRIATSCITSASLGTLVTSNINYVY